MAQLLDLLVIAVVEGDSLREVLDSLLASMGIQRIFVRQVSEIEQAIRDGEKNVLLIPADLPDGDSWRLRGILSQWIYPPPFFVYASQFDFAEWAGVLDAGGLDMLILPFSAEQLRSALSKAASETTWRDTDQ